MCGVPMDVTFHGGSNDTIGGRVRLRRPEISPICPQLPTYMASLYVSPAINLSSLTPVINIHTRISRIFEKIWNDPNWILGCSWDNDSWKKTWSRKSRVRLPLKPFSLVKESLNCTMKTDFLNYVFVWKRNIKCLLCGAEELLIIFCINLSHWKKYFFLQS